MASPNVIKDNGRCKETGKVSFLSKGDAKTALKRMHSSGANMDNKLSVYKCEFCDFHHIGTKTVCGETVPRNYLKIMANIKVNKKS